MKIAADICIYTNHNFTHATLKSEEINDDDDNENEKEPKDQPSQ